MGLKQLYKRKIHQNSSKSQANMIELNRFPVNFQDRKSMNKKTNLVLGINMMIMLEMINLVYFNQKNDPRAIQDSLTSKKRDRGKFTIIQY